MSIPQDFESTLKSIQLYRQINLAPVDAMGCNILTKQTTPAISRYHTLISLLISSQTKDTINFEAMQLLRGLKNGLTVDSILQENPLLIHACIKKVGYHNKKLVYIIESTRILRDKFDSDVPDTLEGLLSLPGVGPKMAYIALQSAWDM